MADLLYYTKMLAKKIAYYDAMVDYTQENRLFNPFCKQPEVTVVWIEAPKSG